MNTSKTIFSKPPERQADQASQPETNDDFEGRQYVYQGSKEERHAEVASQRKTAGGKKPAKPVVKNP